MKECVLCFFLSGKELDIVDDEDIDATVKIREFRDAVFLDRLDEIDREFFARNVEHSLASVGLQHMVADRMHEMGFSEADASVNNERVERRSAQRVRHR